MDHLAEGVLRLSPGEYSVFEQESQQIVAMLSTRPSAGQSRNISTRICAVAYFVYLIVRRDNRRYLRASRTKDIPASTSLRH